MNSSYWGGGKHPELAGTLNTNGNDYGEFMKRYYNGQIVSRAWRYQMEFTYNPYPAVTIAPDSLILMLFTGHYGYANWYECPAT
eukprot:UN12238